MSTPEDQQPVPDVSTEPQRQALDEMSRQLVERLNDMVREQNERVATFAATQHSLSSLPGMPPAPAVPPTTLPLPIEEDTPPAPAPKAKKKKIPFLPQLPTQPKTPQVFEDSTPRERARTDWLNPRSETSEKGAESGCGAFPTVIGIFIIFILLRACS